MIELHIKSQKHSRGKERLAIKHKHECDIVQALKQYEINRLKEEITGQHVSIVFDGTMHVCETMVVVLRYVTDWVIKQSICRLMLLVKSMTGEEVARQIIMAPSWELQVVAAMRDRASVNKVAMRTVSVLYNQMMDIGCFSHTLDHEGENMQTPILDDFSKAWIGLFSRSPKARLAWKTQTGLHPPSFSATRWWSRFEVFHQLHNAFGDVPVFLHGSDMPHATTSKLLKILDDPVKNRKLKMELAITVDAMEPIVKATYILEGDGALALVAYTQLRTLYTVISLERSFPFIDSTTVENIKTELPFYLAAAEEVSAESNPMVWWKAHEVELPNWARIFKLVVLVQPSSAASERVFSLLSNSFTFRRESSLKDYIQLSVMLQYNH